LSSFAKGGGSAVAVVLAFLVCHPRRGSASAFAFVLPFLLVIPEGDLLLFLVVILREPESFGPDLM
jgi:hypothetical protein